MNRLLAAGAATLVCLALGGGLALAQDASEAPGAVWVTEVSPQTCGTLDPGTRTTVDGVVQVRGMLLSCVKTWSDPRASGTLTATHNADDREAAGEVFWGTQELTGPDGTWVGSYHGLFDPEGKLSGATVWQGTGAYAGWTFLETATQGVIYQGPPPPAWEMQSSASE
jgi:hypothetical protein